MMRALLFSELQQHFGGRCYGDDLAFEALETDSRAPLKGKVFLALEGERFDGHQFCHQAWQQGAAGLVVRHYQPEIPLPQWCVGDTRIALGQIAALNRSLFQGPVVAITGNSGKTTVKEMLGAVLSRACEADQVLITAGNFNNDIGVPLTLLRLSPQHRFAVIELGANHLGEIAYCASLAQPDIGVVLNVTGAHLGEFGSMDQIAQAKGELIEALSDKGVVVLNQDDAYAPLWRELAAARPLVAYSMQQQGCPVSAASVCPDEPGYRFQLQLAQDRFEVALQVPARHNVSNALAAAAAALQLGIAPSQIACGLSQFAGVKGRLQTVTGIQQSKIINDSYNANPGSVRAAIDTLRDFSGERILVLGDIAELGDSAAQAHRELGEYARKQGVHRLFTTGPLSALASEAFGENALHFADKVSLVARLRPLLSATSCVLVKGSRSAGMEAVVQGLMPEETDA